ncbi:MAG: molybdenum cofactor guanylyltransferase [bacterium]|jgi:molybdopterin-guanine dinucleotide biosynthesis protein A
MNRIRRDVSSSPIIGAVLAGGQSKRMGRPKHSILLRDGISMIEHVITALQVCGNRIAVVGIDELPKLKTDAELIPVADEFPHLGPLAGVDALLSSGLAQGYIIAACDQPLLTPSLVSRLLREAGSNGSFFGLRGRIEDPLPCYIPSHWQPSVRKAILDNQLSLRNLGEKLGANLLEIDDQERKHLINFNEPEDFARLGVAQAAGAPHA